MAQEGVSFDAGVFEVPSPRSGLPGFPASGSHPFGKGRRSAVKLMHTAVFSVPAWAESVGSVRRRSCSLLTQWGTPVDIDTTELLLSECVTNAIVHGIGCGTSSPQSVRVVLGEDTGFLHVEVHDPDQGEKGRIRARSPKAAEGCCSWTVWH